MANGKQYVGQTVRILEQRWQSHIRSAENGSTFALHRAIRKYGAGSFKVEQIDSAKTLDELNKKEAYYIAQLGTLAPDGYNLTGGGEGRIVSAETRQKLSDVWDSRTVSDETCRKISEMKLGRITSMETRKKMSAAVLGHIVSEETRQKLSKALSGRVMSEETRKRMSDAKLSRRK